MVGLALGKRKDVSFRRTGRKEGREHGSEHCRLGVGAHFKELLPDGLLFH